MTKHSFKHDQYFDNRKGYSEFFDLHCSKCGTTFAVYQKDGPGDLMRAYVDRISDNPELLDFEIDKKLYCKHCGRLMGLGYLYPPEQRPAYNLFQSTVIKKPLSRLRHLYCRWLSLIK